MSQIVISSFSVCRKSEFILPLALNLDIAICDFKILEIAEFNLNPNTSGILKSIQSFNKIVLSNADRFMIQKESKRN